MTLASIAKELGVTSMTIYRRLKKAGHNIEDLRDDAGNITPAGASLIASLFDGVHPVQGVQGDVTECNSDVKQDATPHNTDNDAVKIAVLEVRLAAAQDTIGRLESERDRLLDQIAALNAALEREQADRQNERLLLTGSVEGERKEQSRSRWLFWKR